MIIWIFGISLILSMLFIYLGLTHNMPTLVLIGGLILILTGVFVLTEGLDITEGVVITNNNNTQVTYDYNNTNYKSDYIGALGVIMVLVGLFMSLWIIFY